MRSRCLKKQKRNHISPFVFQVYLNYKGLSLVGFYWGSPGFWAAAAPETESRRFMAPSSGHTRDRQQIQAWERSLKQGCQTPGLEGRF